MSNVFNKAVIQIRLIESSEVRNFLLNSLNPKAPNILSLFGTNTDQKINKYAVVTTVPPCSILENMNFLNIFYQYATYSLCSNLTRILIRLLDKDKALNLLLDRANKNNFGLYLPQEKENEYFKEINFTSHNLLRNTYTHGQSDEIQKEFSDWFGTLTLIQLKKFLGGGENSIIEFFTGHHHYNIFTAPEKLFKTLHKFDSDIIKNIFYDPVRFFLIFSCRYHYPCAKEFLILLEKKFNHDEILNFCYIYYPDHAVYNIFHNIFSQSDKSYIKQGLQFVDCLNDTELRILLTCKARYEQKKWVVENNRNMPPRTPLCLAWTNEYALEAIIYLMQKRPVFGEFLTLESDDNTFPIQWAIKSGNTGMVAYLLEQKVCSSLKNKNLVSYYHKELKILGPKFNGPIIKLLEAYPLLLVFNNNDRKDVPEKSWNALIPLIKKNSKLLEVKWTHNKTLLHHAARFGDTFSIALLIVLGMDVYAMDNNGNTPLDDAKSNGCSESAQRLLRKNLAMLNTDQMEEFELTTFIKVGQLMLENFSKMISQSKRNIKVCHLDLSHIKFSPTGLETSLSPLSTFTQLQTLNLAGLQINDAIIKNFFIDTFKHLTELQCLELQNNIITFNGADYLAWALKENIKIKYINLSSNLIAAEISNLTFLQSEFEECAARPIIDIDQNFIGFLNDSAPKFIKLNNSSSYVFGFFHTKAKSEKSMLNKELQINPDEWIVGLCCSKTGEHAAILMEGMGPNGQKFLERYDIRARDIIGKGEVHLSNQDVSTFKSEDYYLQLKPIKRMDGQLLRCSINAEKGAHIKYSIYPISTINRDNCITWALKKLDAIGVKMERSFFNVPSFSFWR